MMLKWLKSFFCSRPVEIERCDECCAGLDYPWCFVYNGADPKYQDKKFCNNKCLKSFKELTVGKQQEMNEKQNIEYDLNWKEALEAMKRGAIVRMGGPGGDEPKYKVIKVNVLGLVTGDLTQIFCSSDSISGALSVYLKLLSHPLVAKIEEGVHQFFIDIDDTGRLMCRYCSSAPYKLNKLSPFFSTEKHLQQAINDIGTDNLMFMFKALKGIE